MPEVNDIYQEKGGKMQIQIRYVGQQNVDVKGIGKHWEYKDNLSYDELFKGWENVNGALFESLDHV